MKWYRIPPCQNYAISEDGQSVKNITTDQLLNHNVAPYAKDGLRRVTLRCYIRTFNDVTRSFPKVFAIEHLKKYIKEENLIKD